MKKVILCIMATVLSLSTAQAQRLVAYNRYGTNWASTDVSTKNKPNGYIYRLRVDKQCYDLPQVPETQGLELFIAEPIDIGWLGFYRLPTGADDYNFVVVLYNHDKQPTATINLCDVTNNRYCEVQDVRWDADNHNLLFNMACPSYADMINGKGSKLYSYNVENRRIVWETDYLVSNDIFILDRNFVFCSYGFTSEKKFLFMLDKQTGKMYSKIPMVYKVEYLELQEMNGREYLYVVDYNNNLYVYTVVGSQKSGARSQEAEVLTVVYATSDDGYLNVRSQPSTKGNILTKLWMQSHGMGSGVLREKGEKWSKVSVGDVTGWVYTKYMGSQTWYDGKGAQKLIAARDNTPVYGENYADADDYPLFTTVKKGTILGDHFEEYKGYYLLKTAHDNLYIKKEDVIIK
ncbi:MAG: SH3 domain-containing protein [Prevotella sp.]|nr:SH3 domain-containing protein [Prevotella sp.]